MAPRHVTTLTVQRKLPEYLTYVWVSINPPPTDYYQRGEEEEEDREGEIKMSSKKNFTRLKLISSFDHIPSLWTPGPPSFLMHGLDCLLSTDHYLHLKLDTVSLSGPTPSSFHLVDSKKYVYLSSDNLTTPETPDFQRGHLITGEQLAIVSVSPHAQWWDHTSLAGPYRGEGGVCDLLIRNLLWKWKWTQFDYARNARFQRGL